MKRRINHQITLKPQDLMVLFKLIALGDKSNTYSSLSDALGMSSSEVHASIRADRGSVGPTLRSICVCGRLLLEEVRASSSPLRGYIAHQIGILLQNPDFNQALPGHLAGDETSQARMPLIKERLRRLSLAA
jgi:hypothetical protein